METVFLNEKLKNLYETGKSSKYKLPRNIIEAFFDVVAALESAKDIYDLWNLPFLKFEKLTGCRNEYSARLNDKWRLEMTIEWQNEIMTVGIIGLKDISNHYGGSHGKKE